MEKYENPNVTKQAPDTKPPRLPTFDGMDLPPFAPLVKNAQERFEAIRDLQSRKDDIILAAYPKSGTHWTWEIIIMLIQGKAEYCKDVKESLFLEMIPSLDLLEDFPSPRVLDTHIPFRWLPKKHKETGGKIVHVVRNPKDVFVSRFHHINSKSADPAKHIAWDQYFDLSLSDSRQHYGGWFKYEKDFEEAKKTDRQASIHTLYYEVLKKDPETEIRRLAQYLEVHVSDQLIFDIIDKTSFGKLKEANITTKVLRSFMRARKDLPSIYRKGEIGDWKNHFTVAQNERFDAFYAREMKNSTLKVTFE